MKWSKLAIILASALASWPALAQTVRAPFAVSDYFAPAGWMGDGSRGAPLIKIDGDYTGKPRPGDQDGKCMRISWEPRTSSWVGLYWQAPAGNWGSAPGISVVGATKVSFWAAGETGSEIVQFRAGGLHTASMPYKDTFEASSGARRLTTAWRRYEMNLRGQNLTSVIGGFSWMIRKADNMGTVTFYLDDIRYE